MERTGIRMIAVTGMHKSGINFIAGFLIDCGYTAGTSHPVCDGDEFPEDRGHFENRSVITINDCILRMAGGSWRNVPSNQEIVSAGFRCRRMIETFSKTFNGTIMSDPRLCLTTSVWEEFCEKLDYLILCIRNPSRVASALSKSEKMSVVESLQMWYTYNVRCLNSAASLPMVVVDLDTMAHNPFLELSNLVLEMGMTCSDETIENYIDSNSQSFMDFASHGTASTAPIPVNVRKLYELIESESLSSRLAG